MITKQRSKIIQRFYSKTIKIGYQENNKENKNHYNKAI